MSRRPVRTPALSLLTLEDRTTPVASPAIRQGYIFDGPAYTSNPPATSNPPLAEELAVAASPGIAVGPAHTVTITNNQIRWRTIPAGPPVTTNLATFFNLNLTGSPPIWSGAEAIFDPDGQRFVVAATVRAENSGEAFVLLAASDDSDPNGNWIHRSYSANVTGAGAGNNFAADLGLASDDTAVYVTTSHYGVTLGDYRDARVAVVDKFAWFQNNQAGSQPNILDPSAAGEEAAYRALQPAQVYGTAPAGATGTYFVSYTGVSGGADTVRVATITNPLTAPAFSSTTIPVGDIDQGGALPDAPQNVATPLDTGNREVGNAVWRDGRLYFAATINPVAGADAGQATAHWFAVDTATNTVADQGNVSGTANLHTFFPTVAVDVDGSLAVTYSGSEAGDTVKGYYVARRFDDPAGTIRDQVEINPAPTGEGGYVNLDGSSTNVWGPSTSIALDPAGRGFYAFDAFATTPVGTGDNRGRWATKGVGFSFNWAPDVIPGGAIQVVTADEDDGPEDINIRLGFTDYEDIILADPDVPLNFAVVGNTNPGLVTVDQFDPTNSARFRLSYAPDANGDAVITFRAIDSEGASWTRTLNVIVLAKPDNPVGAADAYTVTEDTTLAVDAPGILANDTDPDAGETVNLAAEVGAQPAHGTLELLNTGSFTYTPNLDYSGPDSFTYRAVDSTGLRSALVTVSLTVTAVNDAPVARPDPTATTAYAAVEDVTLNVPAATGVLANDSDVDNATITAVLATQGTKGTVTLNADGSFQYVPNANAFGTDTFTYTATDGLLSSAPTTVTIQIAAADDVPVANDDSYSTPEDVTLNVPAGSGVLFNDVEVDGQPLTITKLSDPLHGVLTLNTDGSFTYVPDADYFGPDSFTYQISDGTSTPSGPATVTITVTQVNDAPVAVDDVFRTKEDVSLTVAAPGVFANDRDVDGTTPTVIPVAGPAHGTLTLNPDGSFIYTPAANYFGPDTFTYKLNDGTADSAVATARLTVTPVQDAPVAVDNGPIAVAGKAVRINVLANDSDVDGDRLSVQNFTAPTKGSVTRVGSQLLYTPRAGATGADSFTYRVSDGKGNTDTATVTLTLADTVAPKVQAVRVYYGPTAYVDLKSLSRSVLPWEHISRVDVVFSEAVTVAAGDLTLATAGGAVATTFGGFNATTNTATWTFADLGRNRFSLRVAGTITDGSLNPIGATWARSFAVLAGDFDGNGLVNATDVSGVKKQKGKVNAFADINGDGVVNDQDAASVTAKVGTRL